MVGRVAHPARLASSVYCPGVAEICFVTRELAPFQPGGIGTFVGAIAPVLASAAEVSVIAPDDCREQYRRSAKPATLASTLGSSTGSSLNEPAARDRRRRSRARI